MKCLPWLLTLGSFLLSKSSSKLGKLTHKNSGAKSFFPHSWELVAGCTESKHSDWYLTEKEVWVLKYS